MATRGTVKLLSRGSGEDPGNCCRRPEMSFDTSALIHNSFYSFFKFIYSELFPLQECSHALSSVTICY